MPRCICPPPAPAAHPLVHFLWVQMRAEDISRDELERRAGLGQGALRLWWYPARTVRKSGRQPKGGILINNLEAALGVFGYSLKPTPQREEKSA